MKIKQQALKELQGQEENAKPSVISIRLTGGLSELLPTAVAESDFTDMSAWVRDCIWNKLRQTQDAGMEKRIAATLGVVIKQQSQMMAALGAVFSVLLQIAKVDPNVQIEENDFMQKAIDAFNARRYPTLPPQEEVKSEKQARPLAEPKLADRSPRSPLSIIDFDDEEQTSGTPITFS